MKAISLANLLDEQGRVTRWPSPKRHGHQIQVQIIEYISQQFEFGRRYTEKEVNALINARHTFKDWATIRRELYDRGYLNREKDGSSYWREK